MTLNIQDEDLKVDFPVFLQAAKQDRLISSKSLDMVEKTFKVKAKYYNAGHAIMLDNCWKEAANDTIKWLAKHNL